MNFNYHVYEANILCPYCDKRCQDDDYTIARELETQLEFECEHCEKKFFAEASICYSTSSDCKLNNKTHDFETSESHPTLFNCKNCSYYEVRK